MNELSRHIEILLLDNDCVIVPEFGGFMAHHKVAEYVAEEGVFYPPQRTLGFNPQLKLNDSLLVQSYVEAYDISYPEAVEKIREEVEEVKQCLSINGEYEFHGIGTISQQADGRYDFLPCAAGLLSPTLYALNSYSFNVLAEGSKETIKVPVSPVENDNFIAEQALEETEVSDFEEEYEAIRINIQTLRNIAAAATILLLLVFSSIPAGRGSSNVKTCSVIDTELISAIISNKSTKKEAISEKVSTPTPQKEVKITTEAKAEGSQETPKKPFVIVLASKVSKQGAEAFVALLKSNGYSEASIYERGSMRKVVYGNFPTESAAANELRQLRNKNEHFSEAWISKL